MPDIAGEWLGPELQDLHQGIAEAVSRRPELLPMVNAALSEAASRRGTQLATAAVLLYDHAEQLEDIPTVAVLHRVVALLARAELDLHAIMTGRAALAGPIPAWMTPGADPDRPPEAAERP